MKDKMIWEVERGLIISLELRISAQIIFAVNVADIHTCTHTYKHTHTNTHNLY